MGPKHALWPQSSVTGLTVSYHSNRTRIRRGVVVLTIILTLTIIRCKINDFESNWIESLCIDLKKFPTYYVLFLHFAAMMYCKMKQIMGISRLGPSTIDLDEWVLVVEIWAWSSWVWVQVPHIYWLYCEQYIQAWWISVFNNVICHLCKTIWSFTHFPQFLTYSDN